MAECDKCCHLKTWFRIREPWDFDKVIQVIRENLKNGTLKHSDYWPEGKVLMEMPPFEKEDWSDSVLYYFECSTCNQLFKLWVEMYHGRGGSWQPIDQESEKP